MPLGPKERRLFNKLTKQGLLDTPDFSVMDVPAYKPPKLPKRLNMPRVDMPAAPSEITTQDFTNYLLTHTSGDKKTASMFGDSLATREGAKSEEMSLLSKLFDTLDVTSDIGVNAVKNLTGLGDDDNGGFLDDLGDTAKGFAGGALKLANDTVLKPAHGLANLTGNEEFTETMEKWENKLLPDQQGRDVLEKAGVDNNAASAIGGLALDLAVDPLTFLGFGAAKLFNRANPNRSTAILDAKAAVGDASAMTRPKFRMPSVAEDALTGNKIPNLNMQVPKLKHVQVGTPLMDEARNAQNFTPLSRGLKRRLDKAKQEGAGGLTKGQYVAARNQELPTPPTRTFVQKAERATADYQRAMMRAGMVAEKGTKFSIRAANEVASKIIAGEIPRVVPVPKATGEVAERARLVADDFIDDLMGPKRVKGRFAKRAQVVEVTAPQQVNLIKKIMGETKPGASEVASVLRAAEDQMIALGVQPIGTNGLRVRLSDYVYSMQKAKPDMKFEEILDNFTMTNMKKMDPTARAIIHGLAAQRSVNMSDILQNVSNYATKAKENLADNYMGRDLMAGEANLIDSAVQHGINMGMTNKEAESIRDLVKDIVNVDKLPADTWIQTSQKALIDAVNDGRADPKLLKAFNEKVAESLGVTSKNLQTKISGSRVADAIMTRVATWWGKGDIQKEAHSVFVWGERNAEVRAATMRYFAKNYSKDERQAAWKVVVGAGQNTDPRIAEVAAFIQRYMDSVLLGPKGTGLQLANAKVKSLSVAERSMMMMEDVNTHLKELNGVKAFQFTKSRKARDAYGNAHDFSKEHDWMRSWIIANPDDPVNFLYDLDLALERVTKEYAFLDDFVDKFGSLTKDSYHNFGMPLPRIQGFYVPEEMGRQMIRVMDDIHKGQWRPATPFGRYYGRALRVWKTGVTIYLPSHHIRNAIGDIHLMWWAGHNDVRPFIWSKRIMASQRTRYNQAMKAGDFDTLQGLTDPQAAKIAATGPQDVILRKNGLEVTADQLYVGAFQRGLLLDANRLEDIFGESAIKFEPLGGYAHKGATQAAELREHYIRLAHFTAAVNKGLKRSKDLKKVMDEAAYEVRKWHPDGRDLTMFEQKYIRNLVPFYSWIRKSTPLMFETLMTRPAKLMAYPRGVTAIQQSLGIDATLTDPFPDDQLFPEWIRGYGIGPIGDPQSDNSIAKWWGLLGRNKIGLDGNPEGYTMVNPSTPFIDSGQQFMGFGMKDTGAGILDSITPFLKVPIDLTKNSDFTGAPITQDEGGEGVVQYLTKQIPLISPVQRVTDFGEDERDGVENPPFNQEALINIMTALGLRGTGPYEKSAEFEAKDRMRRAREK